MGTTKIISRIIIVFTFSTLVSCTSQREKDEAETKDCIKDKAENEKNKSVEEALANYDFLTARKYLACYPNTYYSNDGKRCDFNDHKSNTYVEKLSSIVKAEISYLIANGECVKAKSVATESGMEEDYEKSIPNVINTLMGKREYDNILNILTSLTFKTTFIRDAPANFLSGAYDLSNLNYNQERQKYNDMIDNVLKSALINGDAITAKKCLNLYVPIAITDPKTAAKKERNQKSILYNESKIMAKQKLDESGL